MLIAESSAHMRGKSGRSAGSWCQQMLTSCSSWLCAMSTPTTHFRYGRNGIFSVWHTRSTISVQRICNASFSEINTAALTQNIRTLLLLFPEWSCYHHNIVWTCFCHSFKRHNYSWKSNKASYCGDDYCVFWKVHHTSVPLYLWHFAAAVYTREIIVVWYRMIRLGTHTRYG